MRWRWAATSSTFAACGAATEPERPTTSRRLTSPKGRAHNPEIEAAVETQKRNRGIRTFGGDQG